MRVKTNLLTFTVICIEKYSLSVFINVSNGGGINNL